MFKNTKGIVIDLRCYPSVQMPFSYGEWLKPNYSPFAKTMICALDLPGAHFEGQTFYNGSRSTNFYKGPVVIIVNSNTISSAEFTAMALNSPNTSTIGSTTAGADGNVSTIVIPGGYKTNISGLGIYYPNGDATQRVGIKIQKKVVPSIAGIRQNRDELLEAAIEEIIKSTNNGK